MKAIRLHLVPLALFLPLIGCGSAGQEESATKDIYNPQSSDLRTSGDKQDTLDTATWVTCNSASYSIVYDEITYGGRAVLRVTLTKDANQSRELDARRTVDASGKVVVETESGSVVIDPASNTADLTQLSILDTKETASGCSVAGGGGGGGGGNNSGQRALGAQGQQRFGQQNFNQFDQGYDPFNGGVAQAAQVQGGQQQFGVAQAAQGQQNRAAGGGGCGG